MSEYRGIVEIAKTVRETLKKELPECKFSVVVDQYSMGCSLNVALMSAPFEVFGSDRDTAGNIRHSDYAQLNHYTLLRDEGFDQWNGQNNGNDLTKAAWDTLKHATRIALFEHWDKSDITTDYFHTNFYYHLNIGKWNKPFQVTGPKDKVLLSGTVAEFEGAANSGKMISLSGLAAALNTGG